MKRLLTSITVTLATVFSMLCACGGGTPKPEEDGRKSVILNDIIINELSDCDELRGMDRKIESYMRQWGLVGASLSIMRNDSLVYSKGYGWADKEKKVAMEANNLLRMASVSKLVTATGIMVLQEQGKLSLKDTVFGPSGILRDSVYLSSIKDRNYYRITVEDLLRHKGGFTNGAGDPMFSTRTIMQQNHLSEPPTHDELLKICLRRRLSYVPGTSQAYSNLGYLILSMIIEQKSGMDYEDFIQKNVLRPAGCMDFHIAGIYAKDRRKNESFYYVPENTPEVPEFNNSGKMVKRCYGGNDITALSGAGAWVASTPELCRFVASIDGNPSVHNILSQESIDAMTAYVDESTYSLGWNDTKPSRGWSRTGTFSGTTALIKYFPEGDCWIFIANTSTWKGPSQARYTESLFRSLRSQYGGVIPSRDLFHE